MICCAEDNHNCMSNIWVKRILAFELQIRSYWQNIDFSINCSKFHEDRNFWSIIVIGCFYPVISCFYPIGGSMRGILLFFFNFASCEPLSCQVGCLVLLELNAWIWCILDKIEKLNMAFTITSQPLSYMWFLMDLNDDILQTFLIRTSWWNVTWNNLYL